MASSVKGSGAKKTSLAWKFFDEDQNVLYAECKLCQAKIKRGTSLQSCSSTPLLNHVKLKHWKQYQDVQREKQRTVPAVSSALSLVQPDIQQALQLKETYPTNSEPALALTRAIAKMIAVDVQPFSIVEDEGFKDLLQIAKPRYQLALNSFIIIII